MIGSIFADTLVAGDGTVALWGDAGDDLLIGGAGADLLEGGSGNDVFRYDSASDSTPGSRDAILDFGLGDLVDLARVDANSALGGDQAFGFIGSAAFSYTAGELRATNTSGSLWLVEGDTDGNGVADFAFTVTVIDNGPITSADFVL